jgi:protein SCO1/2
MTMKHGFVMALVVTCLSLPGGLAFAQYNGVPKSGVMTKDGMPAGITPEELKKVEFSQRLDKQLPLDLPFTDEAGQPVKLSQYFKGKPVVLSLVYYECPMLCVQALTGLVKSMRALTLEPGRDFELVTISFNPRETPAKAAETKERYLSILGRPEAGAAWHFLTGDDAAIRLLTDAVGFHYVYDEATEQYAHPTGIVVLTPEGRTSKYIYGLDYGPRDLRLALVEAGDGKIGTPVDALLLYCFHYDPTKGKYGLVVLNLIRLGGAVTVLCVAGFIVIMRRREKRQNA